MKRIITLQDISCAGKCSITAALPVLSCLEVETCVLPTALLSAHTAFRHFISYDLSEHIHEISDSFHENGLEFDAIYTGYLGSDEQIDAILSFIDSHIRPGMLTVVDPAMADNGMLYAGLPQDFASSMMRLIERADVIIPNITEAMMLTGKRFEAEISAEVSAETLKEMFHILSGAGPKTVIITGVHTAPGIIGACCYDRDSDEIFSVTDRKHEGDFPGTGDLFASVVCGCLVQGLDIKTSVENAVHFVSSCIEATLQDTERRWYGLSFEKCLGMLPRMLPGDASSHGAAVADTDAARR